MPPTRPHRPRPRHVLLLLLLLACQVSVPARSPSSPSC